MRLILSFLVLSACFKTEEPETDTGTNEDTGVATDTAEPDDVEEEDPDSGIEPGDSGETEDTATNTDPDPEDPVDTAVDTGSGDTGEPPLLTGELSVCTPSHTDGYQLDSLEMDGSDILVTLSYGGGCETHEWELCWNGLLAESFPMQASLELGHNANNDPCDGWLTETLRFDVSSISSTPTVLKLGSEEVLYE